MFLLDTNVISELRRPRPHGAVAAWIAARPDHELFVAAVSIGEIQRGIEATRRHDAVKAAEIEKWLDRLAATTTIVPMDGNDFRLWARLMVGRDSKLAEDAMIAATARSRGLTVATRDVRDLVQFEVAVVNPFAA